MKKDVMLSTGRPSTTGYPVRARLQYNARYLDPKNDLVFKRVFGKHPDILRAFLNALLPLGPSEKIVSLEYLPPNKAPEIPTIRYSIVDVRCTDKEGRQFIVEMQMQWTKMFMYRLSFSDSRVYVRYPTSRTFITTIKR